MAIKAEASASASPQNAPYKLAATLTGHDKAVSSVKFAPHHDELLASASADKTASVWSFADDNEPKLVQRLQGHTQGINDVAWSHSGRYLCTASDDKCLRFWDAETGQCLKTLTGHTNYVFCCRFNPHDHLMVSGSFDETVCVWDVRSGRCLRTLPAHSDPVTAVDFSPDGTLIASASFDGLCRLWDVHNGHCLKTLIDSESPPVSHVRFSPNGRYLLAATLDSRLRLWDYERGRVVRSYGGHTNQQYCLLSCFATGPAAGGAAAGSGPANAGANGRASGAGSAGNAGAGGDVAAVQVVSGSEDGSVFLWDVNRPQASVQCIPGRAPEAAGDGHCDAVLAVDAHRSRPMLATAGHSQDRTVKLWTRS